MKKLNNAVNILFILIVIGFLFAGLAKTILFPKDINYYENRPANSLFAPSLSSWLNGEFQDNTELSLNDQVQYAQRFKETYYDFTNNIKYKALKYIGEKYPGKKVNYDGYNVYSGEYFTFDYRDKDSTYESFNEKIDALNSMFNNHPDIDFYLYYIEKDTDVNFETGEKLGAYEYLENALSLDAAKCGRFEINSLEEFENFFYKTDHHWNYKGSYKGYTEVLKLLTSGEEIPLPHGNEIFVSHRLSGSKVRMLGSKDLANEDFYGYVFDFPPMDISELDSGNTSYGTQTEYYNGKTAETITYGEYYGGDSAEIVFDTHNTQKDNILIIGESYDNAILKLLSTHFNKTFSVDLRYYEEVAGKFDFSNYLKNNKISKVLLIGNIDYFQMDEFNPE